MLSQLLNGNQVAQILGISRSFSYQLMRSGRIPSIRIGRAIRVHPSALEQFITENIVTKKDFTVDHETSD